MNTVVKRKRPKPGPKRNFKPEVLQMNQIRSYQKALRELVKTGSVTDPDLATRIEAGWHPGIELAVMSVRPDLPDPIKTVISKVLLENTVVSATDKARLEAAVDSPTSINIMIGRGRRVVVSRRQSSIRATRLKSTTPTATGHTCIAPALRRRMRLSNFRLWSTAWFRMAAVSSDRCLLSRRKRMRGNPVVIPTTRTPPVSMSRRIEHT